MGGRTPRLFGYLSLPPAALLTCVYVCMCVYVCGFALCLATTVEYAHA